MQRKLIRRSKAKVDREWFKVRSQWRKEACRTFKEFSANPPPTGQHLRVFTDQGSNHVGTFDGARFIEAKRALECHRRHESRFTACWTMTACGDVAVGQLAVFSRCDRCKERATRENQPTGLRLRPHPKS